MYTLLCFTCLLVPLVSFAQDTIQRWTLGGVTGATWNNYVDFSVMTDHVSVPGALQAREFLPSQNILGELWETAIWHKYQNPINVFYEDGMPRMWRWNRNLNTHGGLNFEIGVFVDGNPTTFHRILKRWENTEFYTIDLGTLLPIRRFVLRSPPELVTRRDGAPLAREIPVDGELTASATDAEISLEGFTGASHPGRASPEEYQPLGILLGTVTENSETPINLSFPPQYLRFFRWRTRNVGEAGFDFNIEDNVTYGDFELYGDGFPRQARYRTKVIDAGRPITLGRVFFGAQELRRVDGALVPAGDADANLGIRFRVGVTPEPRAFFTWNDLGEMVTVDSEEHQSLKSRKGPLDPKYLGWKGPVGHDFENWTPWSGSVPESGAGLDLQSAQYFQILVEFRSQTPTDGLRLDSLSVELIPILVPHLVGEVAILGTISEKLPEVAPGKPTAFTYTIRADFKGETSDGFDAIRIVTPSPPELQNVQMGEPLVAVRPDSTIADGRALNVYLPHRVQDNTEVRINFTTTVYHVSSLFPGSVFNRQNPKLRQQILEGDAGVDLGTNQLRVLSSARGKNPVLGGVVTTPRVVTPNGDGRNDNLEVAYTLFGVLSVDVEICFYDLAGKQVRQLSALGQPAGRHFVRWDGRDKNGRTVNPGVYVCRVTVRTGSGTFEAMRGVGVAF